jgi:hypothetical protein
VSARRAASHLAAEAGRRRVQDRGMDPVACDGRQRKYLQGRDLGGVPEAGAGPGSFRQADGWGRPRKYYDVSTTRSPAAGPLP